MKSKVIYPPLMWLGRQKTYKVVLVLGLGLLLVLLAAVSPFLLAADASAFGRFPPSVRVGGVDVGGLDRARALARCRERLAPLASTPVTLKVDAESWGNTASELGLRIDYERSVDNAYRAAWDTSLPERLIRRFLARPRALDLPLAISYDRGKVERFVRGAMPSINCKARNAYLDVSTGEARVVPARDAREADFDQVVAATEAALSRGQRVVTVPIARRTPAKIRVVPSDRLILVNLAEHTLSLYQRDQLLGKWPVAVGSDKYPTVIGQWKIVKMEKNPTWYNRGSTWMENMPESIPPGPNNPLGTRAMTINGGGVLIHGTTDTGSIGYSVSHGCVRMRIPDVEALYPQCYIGMPVYIIKRGGAPGFDCSKPPFWWGHE